MADYDKVREMYEELKASEQAVERLLKIPEHKQKRKQRRIMVWKLAAACLLAAIIIPAGAFAAGMISQYFQSQTTKEGYRVNMDIQKTGEATDLKEKYVKVTCNFGTEYTLEKSSKDGNDKSYSHKDGFDAGKDFWYRLIRVDADEKTILTSYDVEKMEEKAIGSHKAVYYKINSIVGSQYSSDEDTTYNQRLFIFYDEYGYIVEIDGMQKLGKKGMMALGKKISLQQTTEEKADDFIHLSQYMKNGYTADRVQDTSLLKTKKVAGSVQSMDATIEDDGYTFRVTEVKVTDSVENMAPEGFIDRLSQKSLWNRSGVLKSYERENLQFGDGITEPERKVVGRESIQPKFVQVTMKVKHEKGKTDILDLPELEFLEQQKDGYYFSKCYDKAKRPAYIEDAFMDQTPCYFKETKGGRSFHLLDDIEKGEERTLHFAYLVDEDMTDCMYLCIAGWSKNTEQYVKLEVE